MSNRKFKLLKPLPDVEAGSISVYIPHLNSHYFDEYSFYESELISNPDWFAEVKDETPGKIETAHFSMASVNGNTLEIIPAKQGFSIKIHEISSLDGYVKYEYVPVFGEIPKTGDMFSEPRGNVSGRDPIESAEKETPDIPLPKDYTSFAGMSVAWTCKVCGNMQACNVGTVVTFPICESCLKTLGELVAEKDKYAEVEKQLSSISEGLHRILLSPSPTPEMVDKMVTELSNANFKEANPDPEKKFTEEDMLSFAEVCIADVVVQLRQQGRTIENNRKPLFYNWIKTREGK